MTTKVYLFDTLDKAEELFKIFINKTDNGKTHKYRWTGYMGIFDLGNDRIYCMPNEQYKKWEKTHSGFTTANGEGVLRLMKKERLDEV